MDYVDCQGLLDGIVSALARAGSDDPKREIASLLDRRGVGTEFLALPEWGHLKKSPDIPWREEIREAAIELRGGVKGAIGAASVGPDHDLAIFSADEAGVIRDAFWHVSRDLSPNPLIAGVAMDTERTERVARRVAGEGGPSRTLTLTDREFRLLNAVMDQAVQVAYVSGGEEYEGVLGEDADSEEEIRQLALKIESA